MAIANLTTIEESLGLEPGKLTWRVIPAPHRTARGWRDLTAPDGLDARDEQRADHHVGHAASSGVEQEGDALVAGEQTIDAARGHRADAEQAARHVDHRSQLAVERHVHPVVVAR